MHVTFLTESMHANSLGRTYCLWRLTQHLGWTSTVLTTQGDDVWQPLHGTEFGDSVRLVDRTSVHHEVPVQTDLLVACKPLAPSLGVALEVADVLQIPLLVDVDDPDLEARSRHGRPFTALLRSVRHPLRALADQRYGRVARLLPSIVSNPWLEARYGGTVIPHARDDTGDGPLSTSRHPRIAFVGSARRYKGVPLLRRALEELHVDGFTLVITADPPADARPWEEWIGVTSLEEGAGLVQGADIVALPSLDTPMSRGQLPAKLVDAMIAGRAVLTSDVDPLPWAVADCGLAVAAGSINALVSGLRQLQDPQVRQTLGRQARERALDLFTVEAVAPAFQAACEKAASDGFAVSGVGS